MSTRGNVLVVDDESLIRWSIVQSVQKRGVAGSEAADAREALQRANDADAVILDYRLPDRSGFDVLRDLQRAQPTLPVIMLTAHSSIDHAVQAMKLGAFHYVSKPFELEHMLALVEQAVEGGARRAPPPRVTSSALIGDAPIMQEVRRTITRAAASASPAILISGESGTGKGLAARAIHGESARAEGPCSTASCAAIPPELVGPELFGQERGASPGARVRRLGLLELAGDGTLVLEHIDALPLDVQAKLSASLESRTFRRVGGTEDLPLAARIIATTTIEPDEAVRDGELREDLYDRLAIVQVRMPSLREHTEDIPRLAQRFLEQLDAELDRSARFAPGVIEALVQRRWPGNVRELRNAIERALVSSRSDEVGASAFAQESAAPNEFQLPTSGVDMELLERELLLQALERAAGNQRIAGSMLGMNRDQVRYRMAKYGIPSRRRRQEGEG